MTRTVCHRALALLTVAFTGALGPASAVGQSTSDGKPSGTDSAGAVQTPPPGSMPTPAIQTPAQQQYGLPHNPIVGGPVDIDLNRPLTLDRAIRIGLQRRNVIAIAQSERDVNRALLVEARASYYPQLSPTFQYQNDVSPGNSFVGSSTTSRRVRDTINPIGTGTGTGTGTTGTGTGTGTTGTGTGTTGTGTGTGTTGTGTGTGTTGTGTGTTGTGTSTFVSGSTTTESRTEVVAASITLLDSGQREAQVGYARRNLFASEYNLANSRQGVVLDVTTDYYTLLRDQELVRVQQANVEREQTTLESIQAEIAAGAAAKTDISQAQADLLNAKVTLLSAQNDVYNADAALKNVMGVAVSQPLILATSTVPSPDSTPDPRQVDSYVQAAYMARQDLKQQQELVNAQGYNVRLAIINAGLNLSATLSEGYQLDPTSGEERAFVVSLSYPLFDGGLTRAAVRANKAQLEEQRRTLDDNQQTVRLAVTQDYNTREVSRQQVDAATAAVQAGQVNYDVERDKQRTGLATILDVLNAQVQLVTAQVDQINAIYNYYIADARLQRDIGQNDPIYVPNVPRPRVSRTAGSATPPAPTNPQLPAPANLRGAPDGASGERKP